MAFDHDLIREIKSHADIVDIISFYIPVERKGKGYVAVCPFHNDHDPSLQISKEKQNYHCFACGHSGDVFTFVSDYEKLSFNEAVKKVCEIINFDDPRLHKFENKKPVEVDIQVLYNCINELQKFYEYGLKTEEGDVANKYLLNRGISEEQVTKFGLGFALNDGKKTIRYLQQKGYSLKNIEDIGIALAKTSGTSDLNAGRLMFPIKNHNGQVVGFSARRLNNNDDSPKYVNSPETKIFRKGNILYNYDIAKQTARHDGYVYIVEGFMDVFALDLIGIHSVVGLMGTKLTDNHIDLLKRLNVEVRLCLDLDNAGQDGMMTIFLQLEKARIPYRLVSGEAKEKDPDEILKKEGKDVLTKLVNSLVDSFTFSMAYYKKTNKLETIEDRKKVINHFAPMLLNLKSKLEFDDYLYKLADVTKISVGAIKNYLKEIKTTKENQNSELDIHTNEVKPIVKKVDKKLRRLYSAEKVVISNMVSSTEAIYFYEKNIKYFNNEIYRQLANYLVSYVSEHNEVNVSMLLDLIQESNPENKDQLLNELIYLDENGEHASSSDELIEVLKTCEDVISEERKKIYNKNIITKAFEGKSDQEKARLLDDYLKNMNIK